MNRAVLSFCVALCVLAAPAVGAPSKSVSSFNRMLKLMDSTYDRFESQADRRVNSALRRIDKLERSGASDELIQSVIDQTKVALEVSAAVMREDLAEFNTATQLLIDRQEQSAARNRVLPTINFDEFRRRADRANDSLDADADLLLEDAFATLDAAAPVEEMPEEPF